MKRLCLIILLISFIITSSPDSLYGDVVRLKTGKDIEGVIIEQSENVIRLKVKIGEIKFLSSDVETVIISTKEQNDSLEKSWIESEEDIKYIPPKVSKIDRKGSIIKNDLSFLGSDVKTNTPPKKKKINDKESICVCRVVSISRSLFLNFIRSL